MRRLEGGWFASAVIMLATAPILLSGQQLPVTYEVVTKCGYNLIRVLAGEVEIGLISRNRLVVRQPLLPQTLASLSDFGINADPLDDGEILQLDSSFPPARGLLDRILVRTFLENSAPSWSLGDAPGDPLAELIEQRFFQACPHCYADIMETFSLPRGSDSGGNLTSVPQLTCGTSRIAIVDSSIDLALLNLVSSNAPAFTAFPEVSQADSLSHGTLMGVVIAGKNGGICSTADVVSIYVMKTDDQRETNCTFHGQIAAGLKHVKNQNIPLVNFSLALRMTSAQVHDAFQELETKGTIVIAAAGNSGLKIVNATSIGAHSYPISYGFSNVIGVTGTFTNTLTLVESCPSWNFSETLVHIAADGSHSNQSGTSIATAKVSAAALFLLKDDPSQTPAAIKKKLLASSVEVLCLQDKVVPPRRLEFSCLADPLKCP